MRTTVVLTERMLTHWRRHPVVPVQSLLLPTLLLLTYHLVVSRSMVRLTGADNLTALVPMCTVAGAMMGTIGAGFHLTAERDSGLLSRFWVHPVPRGALLAGTLAAEAVRTLGAGLVILGVGMLLGLRFHGGWLAFAGFLAIPMVVIVVFATVVVAVSVRSRSTALLTLLGTASIGMAFCTGAVAPVEHFPEWLQPAIRLQPLTPVVAAMRALAEGEPAGPALLGAAGWLVVLGAVFGPMAVRGYRAAAQSGGAG
ncbi:ABC transporter permease [Mycolicibacterium sp.]|uniref:ABC transporter permease n=1 Tax=Mycolicibacterium sp. TaxID=2320850 RepID=UPI003D0EA40E